MTVTVSPATAEPTKVGVRRKHVGGVAAWWYDWVDGHRVAAIALVGVIATQLGTYFGYVFPAIGLPTLPWPLFNGLLGAPTRGLRHGRHRSSSGSRSTSSTGSSSPSCTPCSPSR